MTKKLIYPLSVLFLLIANSCNGRNENPTNSNEEVSEDINVNTKFYLDIPADSLFQEDFIIKKGENLGLILSRFDVNSSVVEEIRVKSKDVFDITRLRAGNKYTILSDLNEGFAHYLVYEKNQKDHIVFDLRDSVNIYEYNKDISLKLCSAFGEINSSLWNVINKKGYDIALSDKLSEIYAWQIDFFGIAKGDNFKVLYDQAYIDDSVRIGIEDVKGAIFNHHGKDYYAIPFMQDSIVEFFDENGQSLRKAFLKAPLKYSRISSTFSNARKHPILKIVRPHHGVDYAAPVGTPVRTIGDGVITKKAFQAGGGG